MPETPGPPQAPSGIPLARVVAVVSQAGGQEKVGAGYLVGDRLVLTAAHCAWNKITGRPLPRLRVVQAESGEASRKVRVIAAAPKIDVAVLQLDDVALGAGLPAPVWVRVPRTHTGRLHDCEAVGYPLFQRDPAKRVRGHTELHGWINRTDLHETGRLLLQEPSLSWVGRPAAAPGEQPVDTAWDGLSGAVVFHNGHALGVIVERHPRQGSAVQAIAFDEIRRRAETDPAARKVVDALGLPEVDQLPIAGHLAGTVTRPLAGTQLRDELRGYLDRLEQQQHRRLPGYLPANFNLSLLSQRVRARPGVRVDPGAPASGRPADVYAPAGAFEGSDQRDATAPDDKVGEWADVAQQHARIVALAHPGMGKSWLVRTETARLAQQARNGLEAGDPVEQLPIPFALRVDELASLLDQNGRSSGAARLAAAVTQDATRRHELSARLAVWLTQQLRTGPAALLLDALDEATEQQVAAVRGPLADWCDHNPAGRLLLTSRLAGYLGQSVLSVPVTEVELLPFTPDQVRQYVSAWPLLDDAGRAALLARLDRPDTAGLAQVPLLLALLCRLAENPADPLPTRRGDLYERLLRGFLTAEQRTDADQRLPRDREDTDRLLSVLGGVAYHFADLPAGWTDRLSTDELVTAIEASTRATALGMDARAVLTRLSTEAGVLVPAGDPTGGRNPPYLFLHRTFQEYLAARQLATLSPQVRTEAVERHLWFDPDWEQVLPLLVGALDDPRRLLQHLLHQPDDAFCRGLLLAAAAVPELSVPAAELAGDEIAEVGARLLELLSSVSSKLRHDAWTALRDLGQAMPVRTLQQVLGWLDHPKPEVRAEAARAVAKNPGLEVTSALLTRLDDPNREVRLATMGALAGRPGPEVAAGLLSRLDDPDRDVRWAARTGRPDREVTAALLSRLDDPAHGTPWTVLEALVGRPGPEITAGMLSRLDDPAHGTPWTVLEALAGRPDPEVTAALLTSLDDPDHGVRKAAAEVCLQRRWRTQEALAVLASAPILSPEGLDAAVTIASTAATSAWWTLHVTERRALRRKLADLTRRTLKPA